MNVKLTEWLRQIPATTEMVERAEADQCIYCGSSDGNVVPHSIGGGQYAAVPVCESCEKTDA